MALMSDNNKANLSKGILLSYSARHVFSEYKLCLKKYFYGTAHVKHTVIISPL